MNRIIGIIPARYASSRFPGKSLADIGGKSMIQRVYEQAKKSSRLSMVTVATDAENIYNHVKSFGGDVCLTRNDHPSGTDRCYEALRLQPQAYDYVINIQGDEPFIKPEQIDLLIDTLDGSVEIATLIKKIETADQLANPSVVKTVVAQNKKALYFSRSPIPYVLNTPMEKWLSAAPFYEHVGLYAYRCDVLEKLVNLKVSLLEKSESLEQLRWLENGFSISVAETTTDTICIDTPEDLQRALEFLSRSK